MRTQLLHILRCPQCQGLVHLQKYDTSPSVPEEVLAGLLVCACGMQYAIWRGVPRTLRADDARFPADFVHVYRDRLAVDAPAVSQLALQETSQPALDVQWSMGASSDIAWEMDLATRVGNFFQELELSPDAASGLRVLDAGCGDGAVSAAVAATGLEVIAFDYSNSVERAAETRGGPAGKWAVQYLQADVQHPPFAMHSFDVLYAGGVIHYTPDPHQAFRALASLVKPGGRMFVSLSRRDLPLRYWGKSLKLRMVRCALRPVSPRAMKIVCLGGACLQQTLLRLWQLVGLKKHRKILPVGLKARDFFDTFAASYAHRHTPAEVESWFCEAGFSTVRDATMPVLQPMGFGLLGWRDLGSASAAEAAITADGSR